VAIESLEGVGLELFLRRDGRIRATIQSRACIYFVYFMLGVAWWGIMLAAFVTELYAEAEKGGNRTDKIKRPPWSIKRMANGPPGE
jgi:hypothetical protein